MVEKPIFKCDLQAMAFMGAQWHRVGHLHAQVLYISFRSPSQPHPEEQNKAFYTKSMFLCVSVCLSLHVEAMAVHDN